MTQTYTVYMMNINDAGQVETAATVRGLKIDKALSAARRLAGSRRRAVEAQPGTLRLDGRRGTAWITRES